MTKFKTIDECIESDFNCTQVWISKDELYEILDKFTEFKEITTPNSFESSEKRFIVSVKELKRELEGE